MGTVVSGSGDVARVPRRIFWRTGKETPLEFQDDHIFLHAQWCDWRLGAALVALVRSFDSWLGAPWDDSRK
ncbi:hypothetical protein ACWD9K_26155 [Streptomyces sp. 900116325]|uniref:hypothetical protein n=1 Tax=Streptomyces sp. 900116325 TaxID=3154295 RepID=UPI0033A8351A